jgi:hypothetical protein
MITKDLMFDGVPKWMQRLCIKAHKLIAPEWTVIIRRVKGPLDIKDPEVDAFCIPNLSYLDAEICFDKQRVKNDVNGRREIIHEFLHLALYELATKPSLKTEEQAIVKLSKAFEELL